MSAITTQKELLSKLLVAAGIDKDSIALQKEAKIQIKQAGLYPWAAIISDTARFDVAERREARISKGSKNFYKQVRSRVIQPFVVQVYDQDEGSCTDLVESLFENLPYFWEYKDLHGLVEPQRCEHSDFYSVVSGCYESALLLEFSMDVGPDAQQGKQIQNIEIGG